MTRERRADAIAIAILALLPTLLFADVLLGINSFYTGDIPNYYYPAKKVLREIVLGGHFPYWNPWFAAGQPLAANPEHEVFYPLTWLILLPRFDLGFHILILVHVYVALFAMYALLRSMELGRAAALLGAISFGLGGIVLSTLNLLPCLFSIAWLPLTCLFARRYFLRRAPRDAVLAAIFLGIQFLIGEPTTAMQTGILLGMYAIYRGIKDGGGIRGAAKCVAIVGAISVAALLVAAVQVLPALDHFRDSVRSRGFEFYIVSYWSTPFARLGELAFPGFFGDTRVDGQYLYWGAALYGDALRPFFLSIYCGLLTAVLLLAGIAARVRGAGLTLAIGATSLLFAAGSHTPLLRLLYDAGVADWLRYPEKFVLMGGFAMIVFAAVVLDRMLRGDAAIRKAALWVTAAITFVAFAAWLLASTSAYEPLFRRVWSVDAAKPIAPMLALSRTEWLLGAARGLLLFLLLRNLGRVRRDVWLALLAAFVLLDLGATLPRLAPRVPSAFLRDTPDVVRQLPQNRDEFRIFHQAALNMRSEASRFYRLPRPGYYWITRNSLLPMMPATYRLRMALDVDFDRTQLLPTADFTDSVWGLAAKRPHDWGDIVASMSNVWYVGIHRPPAEALAIARGELRDMQPVRFVERAHDPRYYFANRVVAIRNARDFVDTLARTPDPRGIACVYEGAFAPARGIVRAWSETPNGVRIDVETAGRAFLVMSVTTHKYWRIAIDGIEAPALTTNIAYQGVAVPAGRHVVTMEYRNPLIPAGGAVSIATLLALALIARRSSS